MELLDIFKCASKHSTTAITIIIATAIENSHIHFRKTVKRAERIGSLEILG